MEQLQPYATHFRLIAIPPRALQKPNACTFNLNHAAMFEKESCDFAPENLPHPKNPERPPKTPFWWVLLILGGIWVAISNPASDRHFSWFPWDMHKDLYALGNTRVCGDCNEMYAARMVRAAFSKRESVCPIPRSCMHAHAPPPPTQTRTWAPSLVRAVPKRCLYC